MPSAASQTKVHYEVYRHKGSTEEEFRTIADTYARVMKEDKALCNRAQANLNAGVFINGELHPRWEKGSYMTPNTIVRSMTTNKTSPQALSTSNRKSARSSPSTSSARRLKDARSGRPGSSCPRTLRARAIWKSATVFPAVPRRPAFCPGEMLLFETGFDDGKSASWTRLMRNGLYHATASEYVFHLLSVHVVFLGWPGFVCKALFISVMVSE